MNKLTIKWKSFLVVNYLLLVGTLSVILRIIYLLSNPIYRSTVPGTVFLLGFLFIALFLVSLLNIYIIHRYFPDNPLSPKLRKLFNTVRVLMVIFNAGMLFMTLAVFAAISETSSRSGRWTDMLAVYFFLFLFLASIYILILQYQLPGYLDRKHAGKMNTLIDSIGT